MKRPPSIDDDNNILSMPMPRKKSHKSKNTNSEHTKEDERQD